MAGKQIRPLCGTAQLFLHPRYMHAGAMEVTERERYSAATERDRYGKSVDTTSRSLKMVTSGILNRANSGFSTYTVSRRLFSGVANGNESREGTSVYWKVSSIDEVGGTVADILDREEGLSKPDLVRWADLLDKKGKTQQALEIFEWMQRKKMTFSPSDNVTFVDLLAKTKGVSAAHDFVDGLPPKKENLPATFKLLEYYGRFVHEQWKDSPWSYTPQVEPVKKVHQHRNAKLYGNGTRGNILLQSMNE